VSPADSPGWRGFAEVPPDAGPGGISHCHHSGRPPAARFHRRSGAGVAPEGRA